MKEVREFTLGRCHVGGFSTWLAARTREGVRCLDIEYINNWTYASRGRGKFWAFVEELSQEASARGFQALCVYRVVNPRLEESLPRHGFTLLPTREGKAPTFFKRID